MVILAAERTNAVQPVPTAHSYLALAESVCRFLLTRHASNGNFTA